MTVIELRQYTMIPGRRDEFADLFDREFINGQEAEGIEILGRFLDLDRPDRYVWMRRFPDMERRRAALEAFYTGPVWNRHRDAANATMTEWHDVLLLRPAGQGTDLAVDPSARSSLARSLDTRPRFILVWDVPEVERSAIADEAGRAFADARAVYVTDASANSYPALPIRQDASVVVAILDRRPEDARLVGRAPAQVLRLGPTTGSLRADGRFPLP